MTATPMQILALIMSMAFTPIAIAGIFRTRARLVLRALDTAVAAVTAGLWLIIAIDTGRGKHVIYAVAWVGITLLGALGWDLAIRSRRLEASLSEMRQAWPYRT